MSSQQLFNEAYTRMASRDTQELLLVWQENNRELWSEQAFEALRTVLQDRGVAVPPQHEPTYDLPSPPIRNSTIERIVQGVSRWPLLVLFILWAVIFFPLEELGLFRTPFSIDVRFHSEYMSGMTNTYAYLNLLIVLSYIKFGIVCYGVYAGVSLLRRRSSAVFHAKVYLVQLLGWFICALLVVNVYPFAEVLWGYSGSVMGVGPDWDTAFNSYDDIQPGWTVFLTTLKWYLVPLGCAVLWYVYFSRSAWITERFSLKVPKEE